MKEALLLLIGFALGQFEKWFLDRPVVRLSFKEGSIRFFGNEPGDMPKEVVAPAEALYFILELSIDIYNIGKAPTAIKDLILWFNNTMGPPYFTPTNTLSSNGVNGFNLSPGALQPTKLKLKVDYDENHADLFENIVWFSDFDQQSKVRVIARDIYEKDHYIEIDLIGIRCAI